MVIYIININIHISIYILYIDAPICRVQVQEIDISHEATKSWMHQLEFIST